MMKKMQKCLKVVLISMFAVFMVFAAVACEAEDSTSVPAKQYNITFVCEGETLYETKVEEGKTPVYSGETPSKASTVDKVYAFKGWTPELTAAVADATYTAVFDESTRKYSVTIGDATTEEVEYGQKLTKPADPTKDSTVSTVYTFDGWYNGEEKWDFENDTVTGNLTLVAKYTETTQKYSVTIGDAAEEVEYGQKLTKPADPTKDSTVSTVYTFDGWYNGEEKWDFENDTVSGDFTLVAKFTESARKYAVKFGDATAEEIEYGQKLTKPSDPTKESTVSTVYTFDGWYNGEEKWDFENDTVSGDLTLVAKFTESVRKYSVTIGDAAAEEVEYGQKLTKPADPAKESTESTVFTFDGWYNGEEKWDFENDTVSTDLTLVARYTEGVRKYSVTVDGIAKEYEYGAKVDKPQAKAGCLIVAKNGETEWNFDTDVVKGELTLTVENRLIYADGKELHTFKFWSDDEVSAVKEQGIGAHLNPAGFDGNGIRVAPASNTNVTVVFPKINYNAYGKVGFKFTCNWGTRLIHIGDSVLEGDANKLGSYKGNGTADYTEYWTIEIIGTSITMYDRAGKKVDTWVNGSQADVTISDAVAGGEEALKLTLSGGGLNIEFSDIYCHLASDDQAITVHKWTNDEVMNAEARYTNVTFSYTDDGNTPTSKWAFDWQGRLKASGTGYTGIRIPLVNFNNYASVSFNVYCNWGSRTMTTGDSSWRDQYTLGTVSNTGDTYEQYAIITIKNGKLYFRLNTQESETEVRTLTTEILNGTDNIILTLKGDGNNIVISDMFCTAADYINSLN